MDALLRHDTHLVSDRITRTDQSITINYTKHTDRCESLHLNSVLSYNTATGKPLDESQRIQLLLLLRPLHL